MFKRYFIGWAFTGIIIFFVAGLFSLFSVPRLDAVSPKSFSYQRMVRVRGIGHADSATLYLSESDYKKIKGSNPTVSIFYQGGEYSADLVVYKKVYSQRSSGLSNNFYEATAQELDFNIESPCELECYVKYGDTISCIGIPESAVLHDSVGSFVYKIVNDRIEKTYILTDDSVIYYLCCVTDGLSESDRVVLCAAKAEEIPQYIRRIIAVE